MSLISDNQARMMRHAIGDHRPERYRNSYCVPVGSPDELEWQELVLLGLARTGAKVNNGRDRFYTVTDAGIDAITPRVQAQ